MKKKDFNLFPVLDFVLKDEKEKLLNQKGIAIWMTGLSGSGKTTIAKEIEKKLYSKGFITQVLDGDNIRKGISKNLNFTNEDRAENIRRVAEISKLFINCGIITINSFISPTNSIREKAKTLIGEENFIEVYINAPIETCEKRDVKGLYEKARKGNLNNFTGISSIFESPKNPDIEVNTTELSINESVEKVLNYILPIIKKK